MVERFEANNGKYLIGAVVKIATSDWSVFITHFAIKQHLDIQHFGNKWDIWMAKTTG